MPYFEYRTFLLPQLLIKLGAFSGVAPDRDFFSNDFMNGEIALQHARLLAGEEVASMGSVSTHFQGVICGSWPDRFGAHPHRQHIFDSDWE